MKYIEESTLLEIVVIIVILGVLAAVIIPSVIGYNAHVASDEYIPPPKINSSKYGGMVNIPGDNTLMYRYDTKVVYIMFEDGDDSFMALHISPAGNHYIFEDGYLHEVVKECSCDAHRNNE